jgi:hypothetical protein
MNYLKRDGIEKIYESREQLRIDNGSLYYGSQFVIATGTAAFLVRVKISLIEYIEKNCFNQWDSNIFIYQDGLGIEFSGHTIRFGRKDELPIQFVKR